MVVTSSPLIGKLTDHDNVADTESDDQDTYTSYPEDLPQSEHVEDSLAEEAEDVNEQDEVGSVEDVNVQNEDGLAEEAEDVGVIDESAGILAVKTRAQRRKEEQQKLEDDETTAESGAAPIPLPQLDDSLFIGGREKKRLTRQQKRVQALKRAQEIKLASSQHQKRLTELSRQELEEEQHADDSLDSAWMDAEEGRDGFTVKGGLLCHSSKDDWGDVRDQIVVPQKFRKEMMKLAHGSHLGAHLGAKKTANKILRNFFWKGLNVDVKDYCCSCAECQKGSRRRMMRAPLQPLPTIQEPFKRVAVDIVGPLQRTKRGYKYVLTLMDFCTRYPEAVPLRRTDASTVADALCEIFARMGLPDEILSDQGTNFMSTLLRKVMETLQVKQMKTSPYHPQTNGMLERFHATLKAMLRKTAEERREWDVFLPYVCFAFRDSVHSSTGFSPFQLLLGRDVRGPLSLLYEQLTEKTAGSVTVTEYVEKLKARLRDAWQLAAEHDQEAKKASKCYHDKKARVRQFTTGDQVLVMTPSLTEKLQDQWSGPYVVEEMLNDTTYRVVTPDRGKKSRLFHVNSMKIWKPPLQVMAVKYCEDKESSDVDPDVTPYELQECAAPRISSKLSQQQRLQLEELLQKYDKIFDTTPGHSDVIQHQIATGEAKPVFHPPYRIPATWQGKVRREIEEMLKAGIITPSTSPWTSPIIPLLKKDGGVRLCVDYRRLNEVTMDDRYPMPRVEELLEQMGKAKFISTLDLTKGYYQVSVAPEDRKKTAFMAPMGKFEFTRMPFGLKGAPATFQRLMDVILGSCSEYSRSYIDDIAIFSDSWEDHLLHLEDVLARLERAGLKAKPSKCNLAENYCSFLGHRVGDGKIEMEEAKLDALRNFNRPRTKKDIRAFLGLAGYYRRFIPQFAERTARLSDLTKKDAPSKIEWNQTLEQDFQALKELMCTKPTLYCPDNEKEFILHTDASERGIGAVLSQEKEGEERPIAFFSRKLLPRETRYSTVEKECLGLVAAIKYFDVYLVGRQFQVITDHKALKYLHTMKNANPRLTRWALAIQPFEFTIEHRPGSSHNNADGMSRQAWIDGKDESNCSTAKEGEGSVGYSPQQQSQLRPGANWLRNVLEGQKENQA